MQKARAQEVMEEQKRVSLLQSTSSRLKLVCPTSHPQQYKEKLEELEEAMVQRSSGDEELLASQQKQYEKELTQQRQLYEEKVTELDRLHSQRKVCGGGCGPSL